MLTADNIRSLPVPTDPQWYAFANHLATVHSWYKHLPLFDGGEFVVFLAPDAGENYPTQHPKLPTENTVASYRHAFGHLDYVYRAFPHYDFGRDGPPAPQLDDEIVNVGGFKLYPYVSHEFYWSAHENDVVRIRNGAVHPDAPAIFAAYDADQRMTECWNELSDSERELIINIADEHSPNGRQLSDSAREYLTLETMAHDTYRKLQEPEIIKIRHCVDAVRQWLSHP